MTKKQKSTPSQKLNTARPGELEKMSELEKMPVTEPNVVDDISSNDGDKKKKKKKETISNLLADN